jgi:flagellar biogenesis protein FliO
MATHPKGGRMETIQQTGAVAMVLALLLLSLWWLRRRGFAAMANGLPRAGFLPLARKANVRRLESLERLPLGPQHALHLVRFDGAALLISASPSGCALVHRVEGAAGAETDGAL